MDGSCGAFTILYGVFWLGILVKRICYEMPDRGRGTYLQYVGGIMVRIASEEEMVGRCWM